MTGLLLRVGPSDRGAMNRIPQRRAVSLLIVAVMGT
jgi:hypothetical protein